MKLLFFLMIPFCFYAVTLKPIKVDTTALDPENLWINQASATQNNSLDIQRLLNNDIRFDMQSNGHNMQSPSFRSLTFKATTVYEDGIALFRSVTGIQDLGMSPFIYDSVNFNNGFTSGVSGVSNMGGEVLLHSKKPQDALEANLLMSLKTSGLDVIASAGAKNRGFYLLADMTYRTINSYALSRDFEATPIQPQGDRLNSDLIEKRIKLKLGYEEGTLHVRIKADVLRNEYGIPVQVYNEPPNVFESEATKMRMSDKELNSFAMLVDYILLNQQISAKLYRDDYHDLLDMYTDINFATKLFESSHFYDDRTGMILEDMVNFSNNQEGRFYVNAERFQHRWHVEGTSSDAYMAYDQYRASYAHEYRYIDRFLLDGAISYTSQKVEESAFSDLPAAKSAVDLQIGASYWIDNNLELSMSLARKSRFAVLEEMVPLFPWITPNPDIKPERADMFECAVSTEYANSYFKLLYYYYDLKDAIVNRGSQYINIDSSRAQGVEVNAWHEFLDHRLKMAYRYNDAEDEEGRQRADAPYHRLRIEDEWMLSRKLSLNGSMTYSDSRYNYYADMRHKLSDYVLTDMQLAYIPDRSRAIRLGIKNIFDTDYEWQYGFPAQGRSFYMTMELKL